jgi:hypothetical protein
MKGHHASDVTNRDTTSFNECESIYLIVTGHHKFRNIYNIIIIKSNTIAVGGMTVAIKDAIDNCMILRPAFKLLLQYNIY